MKTMRLCGAAFVVACALPASAGEVWKVVEGDRGATRGNWNIVVGGGRISGDGHMRDARGLEVKYGVVGKVEGDVYSAERIAPSNGVACLYHGAQRGDGVVSGMSRCGDVSGVWTAKRVAN